MKLTNYFQDKYTAIPTLAMHHSIILQWWPCWRAKQYLISHGRDIEEYGILVRFPTGVEHT